MNKDLSEYDCGNARCYDQFHPDKKEKEGGSGIDPAPFFICLLLPGKA